jgi:hypothetical protein
MAEHAEGENNVFVYTGGEQVVPMNVTRVRIDRSVKIIPERAFDNRRELVSVKTHAGIEMIEKSAFYGCESLRGIKLPGVREVGYLAFYHCSAMTVVDFGNKLETIGSHAFDKCRSLRSIEMPTVRTIERYAFLDCKQLTVVEFGNNLERIGGVAFMGCDNFQRIAIPLKDNMFPLHTAYQRCTQFDYCENLTTVDLVGIERIRNTISSLLLESWRDEMNKEIDLINHVLPNTHPREKTDAIRLWIRSVIDRMEHCKAEHHELLKEDMTQLELAVWKAKLDVDEESERDTLDGKAAKKAKIDMESVRKERRITSGADIIIRNVLPFLQLLE